MLNKIFKKNKTYIIAEAGVNHCGDLSLAKELIDIAANSGADAVKFQTFSAEELISTQAPQAEYQKLNTGIKESQLAMAKKLELTKKDFLKLYEYSKDKNITFLSTAFDAECMNYLIKECNIPFIKIPSGEITNAPYLFQAAKHRLPLLVSTGMATLDEIKQALAVLSYGWEHEKQPSSLQECINFYQTDKGAIILEGNFAILHCVTQYPAPYRETNLKSIQTLYNEFKCPIGLSDHSLGIHIPIAAVAMGAKIIEKHFTIDKEMQGPDHKASLSPEELINMVKHIKDIEDAMGDGCKEPQESEIKNIAIARRSIVAAENLKKGTIYMSNNITCKRPGNGVSPMLYWDYLGRKCPIDIKKDYLVK